MSGQHTPGPWEVDEIDNDGEYGNDGPNTRSGFRSYAVLDQQGRVLFDSLNRDGAASEIREEADDEEGFFRAWDEAARRDLTLAAAAPDLLALVDRCEKWLTKVETDEIAQGRRREHSQFLLDLRAAIAKATGSAS